MTTREPIIRSADWDDEVKTTLRRKAINAYFDTATTRQLVGNKLDERFYETKQAHIHLSEDGTELYLGIYLNNETYEAVVTTNDLLELRDTLTAAIDFAIARGIITDDQTTSEQAPQRARLQPA